MSACIFIRSYRGDFEWLKYSLKSIERFVSGYDEIVIVVPYADKPMLDGWGLTKEKVFGCHEMMEGYMAQQSTKMEAWKYTNCDYILYWDSDVMALEAQTPGDHIKNGKPIIWMTKYEDAGTAICWKPITSKAAAYDVEMEFMRRMPLMYHRQSLIEVEKYMMGIHGITIEEYVMRQPARDFSEFNLLGAFCHKFESHIYDFRDTHNADIPVNKTKQYWSWHGFKDGFKDEIENFLK